MSSLKDKYKSPTKEQMKSLESEVGQRRGYAESIDRAGYHKIDSGDNKFRIYPAHAESDDRNFWQPKSTVWLTIEVDVYDEDGKKTGEKAIKRRGVFTSDVHGTKEFEGKDLIKMYIKYATKRIKEMYETKKDQDEVVKDVLFNFEYGLKPSLVWCMYADKYADGNKKLGIFEITNGTKQKFSELISKADDGEDAISADPFTDVENGICVIVTKLGAGLKTEYKVDLDGKRKGMSIVFTPTPLDEDDMIEMEKFQSLEKMFKNSFKRSDYEKQKQGLIAFEEKSGFEFLSEEPFIEQMYEIEAMMDEHYPLNDVTGNDLSNTAESDEDLPQYEDKPKSKVEANIKQLTKEVKKVPIEEYNDEDQDENDQGKEETRAIRQVEENSSKEEDARAKAKARIEVLKAKNKK